MILNIDCLDDIVGYEDNEDGPGYSVLLYSIEASTLRLAVCATEEEAIMKTAQIHGILRTWDHVR